MATHPNSLRKHVGLVGYTNAGKSTLFNALLDQDAAIVSEQKGTTTDPVIKAMELIPYGPIVLIDTPGLDDDSVLGEKRVASARAVIRRCDLLVYVVELASFDERQYLEQFKAFVVPHLLLFTKVEEVGGAIRQKRLARYPAAFVFERGNPASIERIQERLVVELSQLVQDDDSLVGAYISPGGSAVLVTPIDSEAPKGRLILPQVQVIRDCLDHGVLCHICREHELESMMHRLGRVDLVITDSQCFSFVDSVLPRDTPLTSFSLLLARQKGNFDQLVQGAKQLESLPYNARILMLEGCTHNHNHEDIGHVKIPTMLRKKAAKDLHFSYVSGYDLPADYAEYDLIIQCGGCMLNKRELLARLALFHKAGVPVTNYGVILAQLSGILDRVCQNPNSLPHDSRLGPV